MLVHLNRARLKFCQVIGECAKRPQNVTYMETAGIVQLLQPLLTDPDLAIRSNSVCCYGRMAHHSARVASEMIERKVPETLLAELIAERNNNVHYRRAVLQALKAISKHSAETAEHIVGSGGLTAYLVCLEEADVLLREAACCGIGCIVRTSGPMAMAALKQGAAELLVVCLQQNELSVRQVATLALGDIARHSASHAQAICEAGVVGQLVRMVDATDAKLKRQSLNALANIASHNADLAGGIVASELYPKILIHLSHDAVFVQRQAARLVMEIAKHSLELARSVVNAGGIGPLVQCLHKGIGHDEDIITPAAMALGYIAGQSPHFAMVVIEAKGVPALAQVLDNSGGDATERLPAQLGASIWALGLVGQHSSEHCKALCDANVLALLLNLFDGIATHKDVRLKCKETLRTCLNCCLEVAVMEPLMFGAPAVILVMILRQLAKVLAKDAAARTMFQTMGGLKKIQEMHGTGNVEIDELVGAINACYSESVVAFYKNNGGGVDGGVPVMDGDGDRISGGGANMKFMKPQDYFNSDGEASSTDRSVGIINSNRTDI